MQPNRQITCYTAIAGLPRWKVDRHLLQHTNAELKTSGLPHAAIMNCGNPASQKPRKKDDNQGNRRVRSRGRRMTTQGNRHREPRLKNDQDPAVPSLFFSSHKEEAAQGSSGLRKIASATISNGAHGLSSVRGGVLGLGVYWESPSRSALAAQRKNTHT